MFCQHTENCISKSCMNLQWILREEVIFSVSSLCGLGAIHGDITLTILIDMVIRTGPDMLEGPLLTDSRM